MGSGQWRGSELVKVPSVSNCGCSAVAESSLLTDQGSVGECAGRLRSCGWGKSCEKLAFRYDIPVEDQARQNSNMNGNIAKMHWINVRIFQRINLKKKPLFK